MSKTHTILFVDDEASVLDALRRALRGQRDVWNRHFAQSVDEALEKAHATFFDAVVVTGVTMPKLDGLDLLATLQGADTMSGIPVVILTGVGNVDLKRRGLERGAIARPDKPAYPEDQLLSIMTEESPWHFSSEAFAAFYHIEDEFRTIKQELADASQAAA